MNKEVEDALHMLLHCSLKDTEYETQVEQYKIVRNYITNLQQENKQLKIELQEANNNITWWSNRFNAVERDNRQLKNILTELEEWLKEETKLCDDYLIGECHTDYTDVLDKIQELKEKYK